MDHPTACHGKGNPQNVLLQDRFINLLDRWWWVLPHSKCHLTMGGHKRCYFTGAAERLREGISTRAVMVDMLRPAVPRVDYHNDDGGDEASRWFWWLWWFWWQGKGGRDGILSPDPFLGERLRHQHRWHSWLAGILKPTSCKFTQLTKYNGEHQNTTRKRVFFCRTFQILIYFQFQALACTQPVLYSRTEKILFQRELCPGWEWRL